MEDELVLTRSQTQKDLLESDLAAFTARFPFINAGYQTAYQGYIDTAEAFTEDDTFVQDIKVLTADVNASVNEGKGLLGILFLYAEITYDDDKVKQRVFGQDRMDKARSDQEKMMNLLDHAYSFANKDPYKTDLLAKGYTQDEIDALAEVAANIRNKNRIQEDAKAVRPILTQDRIRVYNTVFSRMKQVSKCAQVVFAGDAAKIQSYRVYPPSSPGNETTVEVHLINATTGLPMEGLDVKVIGIEITVTSNAGGVAIIDLGTSPPELVSIRVSGGEITTQDFNDFPIIEGEENVIEIEVAV